jgi:ABC-type polysaccharide/polyol phosphate transport system ATPase subunit
MNRLTIQNEVAISIEGLSKVYKIWKDPIARIKAPLVDILHSWSKGILAKSNYLQRRLPRLGSEYDTKEYYKEVHALLNIFFKVRKGEALGIVGMNGSGKSTLLQILAGTLTPSSGKAHCIGRVAALLELGSGFNPEFTGRENIYLNCAVLGLNKLEIEARINQIIEFSELGEFIEQPVKTYSSGMVVRLAFAAISHVDPDILIVDEALAVGDSYFQHKCTRKIREFKERGGTLLLVSHDPGAIKSICTRCILLDRGKLIKDGPAESVLDYYNAMIAQKEKIFQED